MADTKKLDVEKILYELKDTLGSFDTDEKWRIKCIVDKYQRIKKAKEALEEAKGSYKFFLDYINLSEKLKKAWEVVKAVIDKNR